MKKLSRSTKVFTILTIILLVFSSTYYTIGIANIYINSKADSLTKIEGNDNKKLNLFTLNNCLTTQENTGKTKLPFNYITQKKININEEVFKEKNFNKGDSILIEIPEIGEFEAIIDKVAVDINGVLNLRGQIKNSKYSYVILSIIEDKLTASINLVEENEFYTITYEKNNNSYFLNNIEINIFNNYEECDELIPPTSKSDKDYSSMNNTNNLDEEVNIDVMFVYTQEAKNWADTNLGSIDLAISNAIEESQLVLDNSDVGINLKMVHSAQVDYISRGMLTDVYNITFLKGSSDPRGYMDEVHEWRDEYGADLVVLIVQGGGGRGWLVQPYSGADKGYSVCGINSISAYTVIHEIGHNMGCHHSRNQKDYPASLGGGAYKYSTGWRWQGNDGESYASVMTYRQGSTIVPIFSNPNITWKGQTTGSYTGEYAPADNARSLREMKHKIANFRLYPKVKVYLEKKQLFLNKGDNYKLKTTIEPENALNKNMKWYSSDEKIVTVDGNGLIRGINPGTATITVKMVDGEYYDDCKVKVLEYDINDDGNIDKNDILILSTYYRLKNEDVSFNEDFDFNMDKKIDILEMVLLSKKIN